MSEFVRLENAKSWVWRWFLKAGDEAKCTECEKKLKCIRTTSTLIRHLEIQHGITAEGTPAGYRPEQRPRRPRSSPKHTLRSELLRLLCVCNTSMRQLTEETYRRILQKAYPKQRAPRSAATIRKYLREEAEKVRDVLRSKFQQTVEQGHKVSISFDEATVVGTNRYLTLNVHDSAPLLGDSKVAPLGLIRITQSATGQHIHDMILQRLETVNLPKTHLLAAATDGASNVLRAVGILDIGKQRCFAHGLDLVVRKVVYGKDVFAFDVSILDEGNEESTRRESSDDLRESEIPSTSEENEEETDEEELSVEGGALSAGVDRTSERPGSRRPIKRVPPIPEISSTNFRASGKGFQYTEPDDR